MKKIKLDKIPSIFKNVDLSDEVWIDNHVTAEEGMMVVIQAEENSGKKDVMEFVGGRLGVTLKGDIFAGVLGYRKALVEFAGVVPGKIKVGDQLYLLCESGLIGDVSGVYEAWGKPMKVKILGALVDEKGCSKTLKSYVLPKIKPIQKNIPMICFVATRMDSGKTTMACKIANYFKQHGKKIIAIKSTGVSYLQDPYKLLDNGVEQVLDFTDMGLPSTCNGNVKEVLESTVNLINHAKSVDPDLILMEFGEGILGEYHVLDILKYKPIRDQFSYVVLAANDLTGILGAKEILKKKCKLEIDMVTGPIANSHLGVQLIEKYFQLDAESNQHEIHKTIASINKKLFSG
ncbi:MAG: hypothetical protein PHE48_04845 [Candidatus Daviesbacteria bacterium]|nr:hypothetical protein [Candidatus Daviesbacteria bacterium]